MGFSLKGIIPTGRFVMNVIAEAVRQVTKDTVLLLKGEGSNNQNNNVFVDSSSSNITITRSGNVTQGSFTPFSRPEGEWSTKFSGAERLIFPTQTLAGDFTVECWFLQTEKSANYVPLISDDTGSYNFPVILDYQGSGYVGGYIPGSGPISSGKKVFEMGVWNHIATVRSGSTISVYINGTRVATGAGSSVVTVNKIGGYSTTNFMCKGMLSNVRVSTAALYNGESFTVSTSPLTSTTGTVLLTCQSNNFVDRSPMNNLITLEGTPRIEPAAPFPQADYSAEVHGGSMYFDAVDDYLNIPALTLVDDFTIQAWVYVEPKASGQYIILFNGTTNNQFSIDNTGIGTISYNAGGFAVSTAGIIKRYTWNHVAWSRSGSTMRMFVNGKLVKEGSSTGNVVITRIGHYYANGYTMSGYVADAEILSTALYTTDFTLPSAPTQAAAPSTKLLLKCINAGVVDSTRKNEIETIGLVKVSTAQKKYGTSSIFFPTSSGSDYLRLINRIDPISGDFALEFWFHSTNTAQNPSSYNSIILDTRPTGTNGNYWTVAHNGFSSKVVVSIDSSNVFEIPATSNTWHHFAMTRSGATVRLFLNGVLYHTISNSATFVLNDLKIGRSAFVFNAVPGFQGYLDDLRITSGQALYTANFTPPGAL